MLTFQAPPHPCRVSIRLNNAKTPTDITEVAFARLGPKGGLSFIVRIPSSLIPHPADDASPAGSPNKFGGFTHPVSVDPSEKVDLQLTGGGVKFSVKVCGPLGCAALLPIPPNVEPKFLSTQKLVVGLPSRAGQKQLVLNVPITGMAAAVKAMERIDK